MKPIKYLQSVILLLLVACSGVSQNKSLKNTKPNIILVMTDDQGMGDLACMGNQVLKTPHIDEFYGKSTRFTDFQVSPTCAPTRSALMSGARPFEVGVTHTIMQRERMSLDVFTMPQALQSAGYKTGLFGKWHLGDEEEYLPINRGFDEVLMHGAGGIGQTRYGDFPANENNLYFDNVLLHNNTVVQTKGFCTDVFFDAAESWIQKQEEEKQPYFAYVALNAPHAPLVAPEKYKKRFLELGYDQGTAGRYGMIENIDDNFGELMQKLEAWDALDNTIVIFMTDNGATHLKGSLNGKSVTHFNANLRGGKNSPFEGGTHVPAFWYWKGKFKEGSDVDGLTAHIDMYQTFCELAGVTLPKKMQKLSGKSLVSLLENPKAEWADRELFIHCGRWAAGKREESKFSKSAVRTQQWRFDNNKELFDISLDPSEKNNIASEHPEVIASLQKSYDLWWENVKPLMVNEGLPKVAPEDQPFAKRYNKQLKEQGIPNWAPANTNN
ncbi:arylsulfatase [Wenyingzhuangia sp. 2_MG-2023]|uniref:arylsulfatase n=1 Tax=Wenyingzhuangia sp. 2_MG-2023 TaxID=3062639 RepID=UPI0026E32693|nr:arylsulfatase [Wenyingzhuangia sp. 2_MG-2023]MDO6739322.1 arylsulfatase [Wenyingzhuangia sp. 2_MG-2023]